MKALIVGSSGFIGRHLKEHLESHGIDVWCTTRDQNFRAPKQLHLDLTRTQHFNVGQVAEQSFTHLFDCSGVVSLKYCDENFDQSRLLIVDGAQFLSEMCLNLGIAMVYPSTSLVFDGKVKFAGTHSSKQPIENYAVFKSEAEEIVLSSGFINSVIRFEKILNTSTTILVQWKKSLERGEPVFAFGDRSLSPLSIHTVCRCLNLVSKNSLSGLFHLSSTSEITYFDLAIRLCQRLNKSTALVNQVSSLDFGVKNRDHSCLDSSLVLREDFTLGFSAEICIEDVIEQLIRI